MLVVEVKKLLLTHTYTAAAAAPACSYTYGTIIAGQHKVASITSSNSYVFSNLPVGNTTLFVCAGDPSG